MAGIDVKSPADCGRGFLTGIGRKEMAIAYRTQIFSEVTEFVPRLPCNFRPYAEFKVGGIPPDRRVKLKR